MTHMIHLIHTVVVILMINMTHMDMMVILSSLYYYQFVFAYHNAYIFDIQSCIDSGESEPAPKHTSARKLSTLSDIDDFLKVGDVC